MISQRNLSGRYFGYVARAAGGVYVETVKVAISASWYSKVDAASEPFRYELQRCVLKKLEPNRMPPAIGKRQVRSTLEVC